MNKDNKSVVEFQKKLVNSIEAKTLAVRHVCNSGTHAGIDKVKWSTDAEKASFSLDSIGYKAQPMRLLITRPKGHTKDRHIQLPTFYDRAMQVLYAYSLDPVSEATGCRKSFAFRKGRSQQDVHAHIINAFESADPPQFLIKADVKACYANISHEWLLQNIPINPYVLKQFLKAGHVFGGELFPSDDIGISLGSSLSPILGNMTLDGIQQYIYEKLHGRHPDGGDNLVYMQKCTPNEANELGSDRIKILKEFLAVRGLTLSAEKTHIINITDGFTFLSRHYQYNDRFIYSMPSESAIAKMEKTLRELILPYRGGQKTLIDKLNKKLIGWASYHKITEAHNAFRYIDTVVKTLLLQLCSELNPLLSRKKVINKYFYQEADGNYVYALIDKPDVRVIRIADTILTSYQPVNTKKNPYLDFEYYEERTGEREILSVVGKYKSVWFRQGGKCFYCGKPILNGEKKTLVIIEPTLSENLKNQAYVHKYCSLGEAEFYNSEFDIDTPFELKELLDKMSKSNESLVNTKNWKFSSLMEYFRLKKSSAFTLSFKEIGGIIGKPLCDTAHRTESYWFKRGKNCISQCCLQNGYNVKKLDRNKKRVSFERVDVSGEAVNIPEVFINGRVPDDVKIEVENFFEHIKKKYGL